MLKLTNISKDYVMPSTTVHALKNVSINFRKNEFVAILGPSGCGKTTLLNIIGGLDKYTTGDLVISGQTTKKYKDGDWDTYRNHSVGFIFQSYNLIPHQTILQNVELALTIAGMEKSERIQKAKQALDKVGLSKEYYKKPNQLSGGQCQRVAIARALVNEPEILLADEPTGALDTQTSVQIMELIKEIAKEKLVIMVTHNPELADIYANRIIRLLDGEIVSDSNPYTEDEKTEIKEKVKKSKMSVFTAFRLSAKNLLSKFKRTLMVGLAGSIGIIGISLVLALSSGISDYIDDMQEDMLSGNPVTISESTYDINAITNSMSDLEKTEIVIKNGIVSVSSILEFIAKQANMLNSLMVKNNITKEYAEYVLNMPKEYVEEITTSYGIAMTNSIYTSFKDKKEGTNKLTSLSTIKQTYTAILSESEYKDYSTYITTLSSSMKQAISNEEYIKAQYNVLSGKIATKKDEIMIVVDKNQQISDLLLAQLGYYTQEEFLNMSYKAFDKEGELYDSSLDKTEFTFEELLDKKFYWFPNDVIYKKNNILPMQPFSYNAYMEDTSEAIELKVVGIIQTKENVNYGTLSSGFYYSPELQEEVIKQNEESEIVKYLKDNNKTGFHVSTTDLTNSCFVGYTLKYYYEGAQKSKQSVVMGNTTNSMFSFGLNTKATILDIRDLGGDTTPNYFAIYPKDFKQKEKALAYLDAWNKDVALEINGTTYEKSQREDISYTDNLSLVISMINTMIDVVTTALISFTAISLVVSTVMIGIITYVSVVERTKEIGVIRSLGGRKKDVGHLFTAETFIVGFVAGLMGIIVTYLISLIANVIIGHFTGIYTLVSLKPYQAIIMIVISVLLTTISGLFPSRAAAKLDPVNALRSE